MTHVVTGNAKFLIAKATVDASLTNKQEAQNSGFWRLFATWVTWAVGLARFQATQLGRRVANAFNRWADASAAAALYENLSRLSDAELARRGIPRADLYRHVSETLADNKSRRGQD